MEFEEFKEFKEFKNEASAPVAIRRPPMRGQHKVGVYLFLRDEIALPYVDAHGRPNERPRPRGSSHLFLW